MTDAFNLDAVLAEHEDKPLTYKGKTFTLPGELPGAAVAPFLDEDLGLVDLITDALADADDDADVIDLVVDALKKQPRLPLRLVTAAGAALKGLLGEEYEEFQKLNPSVTAYFAIAKAVVTEYGMSLADFFGSPESSGSDGGNSKQTSNANTESTPAESGVAQETPAS